MKTIIMLIAGSIIMSGIALTSCKPADKNAKIYVTDSNEDYLTQVANYKIASSYKIEANNKRIAEFNARIAEEKLETRADYLEEMAELEKKNTDLQKRLEDFKADGNDSWESFKTEFQNS